MSDLSIQAFMSHNITRVNINILVDMSTKRRIRYNLMEYKHKYTYAHIGNFLYPHSSKLNSIVFLFCRNSNTNKREMTTCTTIAIRCNNNNEIKIRKEFHYWIRFVKRYQVFTIRSVKSADVLWIWWAE